MRQASAKRKKESAARDVWKRMKKNKAAMVGLVILSLFALLAIFAGVISPKELVSLQNGQAILQPPSAQHWFGTDEFGRDLFTRVIYGGRLSLTLGLVTTAISLVIGGLVGAACGFYGGWFDTIVMRVVDVFMCIPSLLFALAVVAALGPGMGNLLIAITISSVPSYVRMIRSVILSIVGLDYIEAARACGTRDFKIIMKHVLPNAMGPIIVQASMSVAGMMLTAAGLSFVGMGVQPPTPEWGSLLNSAREHMRTSPYLLIFPGLCIGLSALSLNLIGDGLRDALDPRLRA